MNDEFDIKLSRIKGLLVEKSLDALLIQRVSNFAWLSCGSASYINTADEAGVASLLVTHDNHYLITNNIEEPHFRIEENLENRGWEFRVAHWYQTTEALVDLSKGLRLGNDGLYAHGEDISDELIRLRADLLPIEQKRFRELSKGCAQAMKAAIYSIEPGMSEFEIAATLAHETQQKGILPIVNLIATDERIYSYRHPLPTHKQLDQYVMLVLCGRMDGLVASITRLVHFGPLPEDLYKKSIDLANIDAYFIVSTQPGKGLSEIFAGAQAKYAEAGYADEWRLHHQGGPAGYAPREAIATPDADWMVKEGQVFAWNPSITGTKSEDTILISSEGNEIMTAVPGWPEIEVEIDGQINSRPAILEIA